jgi:hypothetical protein
MCAGGALCGFFELWFGGLHSLFDIVLCRMCRAVALA